MILLANLCQVLRCVSPSLNMSFRTERQRSEESLRPHLDMWAALEKRFLIFRTSVDVFANGRRLFLHGSRDSSLRWRSVRNDMFGAVARCIPGALSCPTGPRRLAIAYNPLNLT